MASLHSARDKLWHVLEHHILGLNDEPHRIARGVFLGTVVAFTPTLGLQMMIYVLAKLVTYLKYQMVMKILMFQLHPLMMELQIM